MSHAPLSEQLTPQERRSLLRAFADRALLTVSEMEAPKDMVEAERALRVGALIERIYTRCDTAEALHDKQATSRIVHRVQFHKKSEWERDLIRTGKLPPQTPEPAPQSPNLLDNLYAELKSHTAIDEETFVGLDDDPYPDDAWFPDDAPIAHSRKPDPP